MKVLVTGGAGYIGSVVVSQLAGAGHDVVVFDNLSRGHADAIPASVELVVGDLTDITSVERIFTTYKPEAIMHFAAWIEAGESMQDPAKYFRNNSFNALNLLECAIRYRTLRFVFSSTAALYGEPDRIPICETDLLRPTNAYGESKLLVEKMLGWFHRIHGLSYVSLRYFNAAGATETLGERHNPETHLIPIILDVAEGKRPHISIYGTDYSTPDGTCIRDYIHVSDLATAHLLALEGLVASESPKQMIYNLGNGRGFSVREVIAAARKVTETTIATVESERRPGDPAVLVASSEKIRSELGWKPKHFELEEIIRSAWEWRHKAG